MAEKTKIDLSKIESTDIVYGVYNGKELLRECNTRDSAISYAERHSATSVIKKRIGITNEGVKVCLDENLETCWEHIEETKSLNDTPEDTQEPSKEFKTAPVELEEELHQSLIDKEDFVDSTLYEAYKTAKEQIANKDFDKLLFIRNLQEEITNYLKTDSWKLSESYFKEKYNEISNSNIFNVSVAITNKIVDRVKFDLLN